MSSRITPTELSIASRLMGIAQEEFSNHGCNDFRLENTDENWRFVMDMHAWNGDEESLGNRPPPGKDIWTQDFFVMSYLAHRLGIDEGDE